MSIRSTLITLRSAVLAVGAILIFAGTAFGDTAVIPVSWSLAAQAGFPEPVLFGSLNNTFTFYNFPFPYATGTFYVGSTGAYTVSLTTPGVDNLVYLLTPGPLTISGSTPTNPLSNFIAGEVNVNTTTFSTTLQAGVQYAYVLYFTTNSGSTTFNISGPGCISLGGNTCLVAAPTLEPGPLALLAILVAVSGMFFLRRRPRTIA